MLVIHYIIKDLNYHTCAKLVESLKSSSTSKVNAKAVGYEYKVCFKHSNERYFNFYEVDYVLKFPEWSYEGTKIIVLSKTMKEVPDDLKGKAVLYDGSSE